MKGTKWRFPSSMSMMFPEPHTEMTSSLRNSIFSIFFFFPPFPILDFEPPYDLVRMIASFTAGKVNMNRKK